VINRSFWAFIPARRHSQRFPNKVMTPLLGKPMVMHVYDRIAHLFDSDRCYILVDDPDNYTALKAYTPNVLMTPSSCKNGSERIYEAVQLLNVESEDIVLNIQGDEPLVDEVHIRSLMAPFHHIQDRSALSVSTVVYPLQHPLDLLNPNRVKVLPGPNHKCLAFFRRIPQYLASSNVFYLHGGFYGYSATTLAKYLQLPQGELEVKERLEQIRFLGHNIPIYFTLCEHATLGVDTSDDLKNVEAILKHQVDEAEYSIRKDL